MKYDRPKPPIGRLSLLSSNSSSIEPLTGNQVGSIIGLFKEINMKIITQREYETLLTEVEKSILEDAVIDLSPENLTCDGELTLRAVRARKTQLLNKINVIELRVNRVIPQDIVYDNIRRFIKE